MLGLIVTEATPQTLEERLEEVLQRITDAMSLEIYLFELRPRQDGLLKLVIDRPGGSEPGKGITVGELAQVTREFEAVLETTAMVPFEYRIECSSPGVERELTLDRHFAGAVGSRVRATLRSPDASGRGIFEGLLLAWDGATVTIEDASGPQTVDRDAIRRAKVLYQFVNPKPTGPDPKPNSGKEKRPTGKPKR